MKYKLWGIVLMITFILTGCGSNNAKNEELMAPLHDVVYTADNGLQICFRSDGMLWRYNPNSVNEKEGTSEYRVLGVDNGILQIQGGEAVTRNGAQEIPIYEVSIDNNYEEITYSLNDKLVYYKENVSSGTIFADQVFDSSGNLMFEKLQEYVDENGYEVVQVESGKGGYYDNSSRQDTSERSWGKYGTYKDFSYSYSGDFEYYSYSGYGFESSYNLTNKAVSGSGYRFRGYDLDGLNSLPQAGTCYFSDPFFIRIEGQKSIVYKIPNSEAFTVNGAIDFSKTEAKVYMDDPEHKYEQAINLYEMKNYSEAYLLFEELGSYEDSSKYMTDIENEMADIYEMAGKYMQPGNEYDPAKAFETYSSIIIYEDSEDKAMEAFYQVCFDGFGLDEKYANALTSMIQHFEPIPATDVKNYIVGDSWFLMGDKAQRITKDIVFLSNGETEPLERKNYKNPLIYHWRAINDKLFLATTNRDDDNYQYDVYKINDDVIALYSTKEDTVRTLLIKQNSVWSERIIGVGRQFGE